VRRVGRFAAGLIAATAVVLMTAWAALAIHYSDLSPPLRDPLAIAFVAGTVLAFAVLPRRRRTLLGFLVAFAVVLVWWLRIAPSNDRDWQPDVARLPWADVNGERITIHNIRNFEYRSETEYTPRWYDATFDLADLRSADLVAVYWMGDAIAHVMVSFGFTGDRYLAVSIETRKERGESYSTLAGFYKQYELIYVVADERDVVRLRTNCRHDPPEDVYLYRLRGTREEARGLFLEFLEEINRLRERPEFYNTLATNCTTNIWLHARGVSGRPPLSWRVLVSGYAPELLYDSGKLESSLPFDELKRRSRINDFAMAADRADDFSQRIRAHLPGVTQRTAA